MIWPRRKAVTSSRYLPGRSWAMVAREYADVLPNAVFREIDGSGHDIHL
ncbi:hypothetical protein [Nonomuraea dietziae]